LAKQTLFGKSIVIFLGIIDESVEAHSKSALAKAANKVAKSKNTVKYEGRDVRGSKPSLDPSTEFQSTEDNNNYDVQSYTKFIYDNNISPEINRVVKKICSYGISKQSLRITWGDSDGSDISGLQELSLFERLNTINEKSIEQGMTLVEYFNGPYLDKVKSNIKNKKNIQPTINISVGRFIGKEYFKTVQDNFNIDSTKSFGECVKQNINTEFSTKKSYKKKRKQGLVTSNFLLQNIHNSTQVSCTIIIIL